MEIASETVVVKKNDCIVIEEELVEEGDLIRSYTSDLWRIIL